MVKRELLDIIENETSRVFEESDLKLKLHEAGIDSVKLIRTIVAIEKRYNKRLMGFIEGDETFESVDEFIEKVQNELN